MNTRPYRLAYLSANPVPYHVALYRALASHPQIDLTVLFCSDHGMAGEQVDPEFGIPLEWGGSLLEGYASSFLPNWRRKASPGYFLSIVNPGIFPALWKGRYDALIIPGYSYLSYLLGFLAAWLSGTPVFLRGEMILKTGVNTSWAKGLLLKTILRGTSACLAIGTPSLLFYKAYGVPPEKIFRSPYQVDNAFFERESRRWRSRRPELKRSLGIDSEIPVILFCGKLISRKRPGDLLEAFLRLSRPAALLFVGEGPLKGDLQRRAEGARVFFPGFIRQGELPKYYALADLFVLPSEQEVSPLVVNEAMASGLPILLSDAIPSAVDLVRAGENGFVFPLGEVGTLHACLERLLADEGPRQKMGQESLKIIRNWGPQTSVEGVFEALTQVDRRMGEVRGAV